MWVSLCSWIADIEYKCDAIYCIYSPGGKTKYIYIYKKHYKKCVKHKIDTLENNTF